MIKRSEILRLISSLGKIKNLLAVYVFGSCANGKIHENSDIDICVIGKLSREEKEGVFDIISSDKYDLSFFSDLPIWIKMRVFQGKALFIKDKESLYDVYFRTLKEYTDFKPAINRFCEETICMT